MTVYMVRDILSDSYASTEQYGELKIIAPTTGNEVIYGPSPGRERVIDKISHALNEFSDSDYLYLPGDPAFILPAIEIAARCNEGRVQFLKRDESNGFYMEEKVDLSGNKPTENWLSAVFRIQELVPLCIDRYCQLHGSGRDFWLLIISSAACQLDSDEELEVAWEDPFCIHQPLPEAIFTTIIEALRNLEFRSSDWEKLRGLLMRLEESKQREMQKIEWLLQYRKTKFYERHVRRKRRLPTFVPLDDLL